MSGGGAEGEACVQSRDFAKENRLVSRFWNSWPRPLDKGREVSVRHNDGSEIAVDIGLNPMSTNGARFALDLTVFAVNLQARQITHKSALGPVVALSTIGDDVALETIVKPVELPGAVTAPCGRLVNELVIPANVPNQFMAN